MDQWPQNFAVASNGVIRLARLQSPASLQAKGGHTTDWSTTQVLGQPTSDEAHQQPQPNVAQHPNLGLPNSPSTTPDLNTLNQADLSRPQRTCKPAAPTYAQCKKHLAHLHQSQQPKPLRYQDPNQTQRTTNPNRTEPTAYERKKSCLPIFLFLFPSPACAPAGPDAIVDALRREHGCNEHKRYEVVASAANAEERSAFVAVAWEYAPVGGGQARWGAGVTSLCSSPTCTGCLGLSLPINVIVIIVKSWSSSNRHQHH